MSDAEKEIMLDLLCDKFVYGLDENESKQLSELGFDAREADSIEQTIAALGLVDLDAEAAMPAHLHTKVLRSADAFFASEASAAAAEAADDELPSRQIVLSGGSGSSWFSWLGWGFATAASVALAFVLFTGRGADNRAGVQPTPTPVPAERLDPSQQRQRLIDSSPGEVIMAQWGKGNVKELEGVSGDVVWSDEKQTGYMRFKGLAKNDVSKETYQLWIFDETQDPKTPIDGGTFDVNSDGEVIVPIDAKLKARKPAAFAITIEKPGGVVVSDRKRIAVLAPVKPTST